MRYVSTSGRHSTDLRGAVAGCFAPDGSLYLPEKIAPIPRALFNNFAEMTVGEIAYIVASQLLGPDVDRAVLKRVVDDTFLYPMPLIDIADGVKVLELFHGPTLAFKDFGAQFAANFFRLADPSARPRVTIVATTGNTGAAVANAFADAGRHTVVLYPQGAMNRSQLAQITTLGPSVHALEVSGDIARCKDMVRQAMADESLAEHMSLACLNTANFLKIIPQVVLCFYACSRMKRAGDAVGDVAFALPCGNLSMLLAAVIARRLGLPFGRIVAGCNANDDFAALLAGRIDRTAINHTARQTLARAMDAGYPTNLERILRLYDGDIARMAAEISAFAVADSEIADTVRQYAERGYLADPHTAVAIAALGKAGLPAGTPGVAFATAHPAKSLDTITEITGRAIDLPLQLTRFMTRGEAPRKIPPTYAALRKFLLSKIN